jgi:hypothetical protein
MEKYSDIGSGAPPDSEPDTVGYPAANATSASPVASTINFGQYA